VTSALEMSGYLHSPTVYPQGNSSWSLDTRLGGPQSRSGLYGEYKNLAPAGDRTPAVQPVARLHTYQASPLYVHGAAVNSHSCWYL
jgi:hypothetical protein